jgi:hypothetical protein
MLITMIFLIPMIVGEMSSNQLEKQSAHNTDVCSGLHGELKQKSTGYYQNVTKYDRKTAEYASALFEYNKESTPSPSYTSQIQQMYKELQQMYKELTNLEIEVNTLADQYNRQCVT